MTENERKAPQSDILLFFVIDGEVVQNLRTNERFAAVLTSEPTVIVYDEAKHGARPKAGDKWDGNKFISTTPTE